MSSAGASIDATLTLDIEPFKTNITQAEELVKSLQSSFQSVEVFTGIEDEITNLETKLDSLKDQIDTIFNTTYNSSIFSIPLEQVTMLQQQLVNANALINNMGVSYATIPATITPQLSILTSIASILMSSVSINNSIRSSYVQQAQAISLVASNAQRVVAAISQIMSLTSSENSLLGEQEGLYTTIDTTARERTSAEEQTVSVENEELSILEKIVSLKEKILSLTKSNTSAVEAEAVAEAESAAMTSSSSKTNSLDKMSNIGRRTGSMLATMFLFNEAMDVFEMTMDKVNASQQLTYFGQRLGMTQSQISSFANEVNDLQKVYKKIDMTSVAATAEEAAVKYGLQTSSLKTLAETYAVVGTAFKKEGRTQEDAILAVNDAMDGEFRRLKELGIKQEDLEEAGWSGDTSDKEGIMNALMKIMDERGFTQTAKDITSFSDALEVAKLQLAELLKKLFQIAEPSLTKALQVFIWIFDAIGAAIDWLLSVGDGLPDWAKNLISWFTGGAIAGGILAFAFYKIAKGAISAIEGIKELGKTIKNVFGKINKTLDNTGSDSDSETSDTDTSTGGTKLENLGDLKKAIKSDLLTMARYFVDAAVGLAMAGALIAEGMVIIAGLGWLYGQLGTGVDQGIEAINKIAIYVVPVIVAVMGLQLALDNIKGMKVTWSGMTQTAQLLLQAILGVTLVMGLLAVGMAELAAIGTFASWLGTANIQSGVDAITQIAPIVVTIAVAILALGIALSLPAIGEIATAFETKGIVEACAILCTAIVAVDVILALLVPAILIIAGIGAIANNFGDVDKGVETIYAVAPIVITITAAILALGTALSIPAVGEIATVLESKGIAEACTILVEAVLLTSVVIASLIPAIEVIATIGSEYGANEDVSSGVEVINSTASIIQPIVSALINFSNAFNIDASSISADTIEANKDLLISAIDESANVINELQVPIAKINELGVNIDLTQLQAGVTVLQNMGTALESMKNAVQNITTTIQTLNANYVTPEGFQLVLTQLTTDIGYMKDFMANIVAMGFGEIGDVSVVASAVQSAATTITSIKSAVDSVKSAIGAINDTATASGGMLTGAQIWATGGSSLDGAFDQLYNALVSIQTFLTKANSLDFSGGENGISGITAMITALADGVSQLVTAVQGHVDTLKTAGADLAQAIATGANGKASTVKQAGTDLGKQFASGADSGSDGASDVISAECDEMVNAVNNHQGSMYSAGYNLAQQLILGTEDGTQHHSPGLAARLIASEVDYMVSAVTSQTKAMYLAGREIGTALSDGYSASPNLKTNISGLRKSSISSSRGGLNIQAPQGNDKSQGGGDTINITISMPNSTFYGDGDMEAKLQTIATNVFVDMNSPSPNTGN